MGSRKRIDYPPRVREVVTQYCKDHTIDEASKHFGIPAPTIYGWFYRGGITDFKRDPIRGIPKREIDQAMAILEARTPPYFAWSSEEIASACGVSHQAIDQMFNRALKSALFKIRTEYPEIQYRNHTRF